MRAVRWLLNFLLVLLTLTLLLTGILFLLGNPQPVVLDLLVVAWQPSAALGQWLLAFLLCGIAIGLLAGLALSGAFRLRRQRR
ncbi:hypothetical protein K8B33_03560 [Alcanivorax sp. JB21]|uniref:lipopolysaccharide assembly protein LapA domain-containing protein n=1 Tax=Alcanivorax limicola TaxID=2874102 RepID=UPI001CBF5AD2|nr:lipopolysaccharide assembly protein LapA domain-containing protein [Alcanivorax limicola]MBZ2188157.1 hypothetical protein [Alcanivorax limicola]